MKKNIFLSLLITLVVGFTACNNVDEPQKPDNSVKPPYSETFATAIGKFTEQSVTGTQKWTADSKGYMKMSGHVSQTEKYANEDWLISPKIDLTGISAAKMTFDYNASFFKDLATEATVWVSDNYTEGLPSTATWQQLNVNLKSVGSWDIIPSDEISLTPYAGKKINVAFKYTSTATDAGTWEIKNFMVQEGEAAVVEQPTASGSGTEASPYNVAAAMANQGAAAWVEGYIVGNVDGEGMNMKTESKFSAPFTIKTNILLAATADETDYNNCIPVQLPAGAIRDGLNLVDNAGNDGKKVKLYGMLETYFGAPGLRSVSYYELEGGKTGGTKPADTSGAVLAETLLTQASYDKFTAVSVSGDQAWKFDSRYGAVMSGYADNRSYANEDWFISPAMNLAGKSNVKLSFEHARGPAGSMNVGLSNYTVWVSNDYNSGAPSTATWTEITGVTHGTAAWGFVSSGELTIPAANLKPNAKIAFKYLCSDTESATWEIKNVVVK